MKKLMFAGAVFASCLAMATDYAYTVAEADLNHAEEIYPTATADKTAFTGVDLSEWRVAGAVLSGVRSRVGYTISPTWRIRGTSASTIKAGILLAPNFGGDRILTLNGVRLNVACDAATSRVRFGTSSGGLTAAQLNRIRLNGKHAKLLDDGTLVQNPPGLVITFR